MKILKQWAIKTHAYKILLLYLFMKTNVVLASSDRELFGIKIKQETKTGFLNISDLQEAYTIARLKNGWHDKRISDILMSQSNTERIYYLLEKQQIINTGFSAFMKTVKEIGLVKALKEVGAYKTSGARENKKTWCNPYIWVLIAMELNPELYATTVLWLGDNLIINRIEAGNFYKELSSAISRFQNPDYVKLAKGLNYVVFGKHETGIRNFATQSELKQMETLEGRLAFAINMGYIKTFDSLIDELRKLYDKRPKLNS